MLYVASTYCIVARCYLSLDLSSMRDKASVWNQGFVRRVALVSSVAASIRQPVVNCFITQEPQCMGTAPAQDKGLRRSTAGGHSMT